jgi:large subunit ribosomal protein L14
MIQAQSMLRVLDNSGARWVKCIRVQGKTFKGRAQLGSVLVVSIQKVKPREKPKVEKGQVCLAVVIQMRTIRRRRRGSTLSFLNNGVALVSSKSKAIGSRLYTVVPRELRRGKFLKLVSLARAFV